MRWITTTQALESLADSDEAATWNAFCDQFRPVLVNFAIKLGLSTADAEDAAQETMVAFLKAFRAQKYDQQKGRLSAWLFGIARRVILNFRAHQPLEHLVADKTTGTSFWDLIEGDQCIKDCWQTEWRHLVLTKCLEQTRREFDPKVFKAFELYALSGMAADKVAKRLGTSRNSVYIAKSRILARLRQLEHESDGA
jgi:RNA polymerase sigma-70 factor (ECF subfamily)